MLDNESILASPLLSKEHLTVFDKILRDRWANIDLTPVLMYFIDVVPPEALPALGSQFGVMGFGGWVLCTSDEEKRSLIKKAIELKRFSGTPWAIIEALKSVGYYDAQIQEGTTGALYDDTYVYDGTISYGGDSTSWANFRVSLLDLGEGKGFSAGDLALIIGLIKKYKNARSILQDIILKATTADDFDTIDDDSLTLAGTIEPMVDELGVTYLYDGDQLYDGSIYYAADTDKLTISIHPAPDEDVFSGVDDSNFKIKIIPLNGVIQLLSEDEGFYFVAEQGGNPFMTEDSEEAYEGP